ncbi:MAG TPA: hypothetical protein PKA19_04800 [Bacillota bacterium]|nr:hypothetical protein [Bacillota bacterium]
MKRDHAAGIGGEMEISMSEKMTQELYRELLGRLTDRQLLKGFKLSKKAMLELIQPESARWKAGIRDITSRETVVCKDVLKLCEPALSSFSEEPEEGWLSYIYNGILHRLFPEETEKREENPRDAAGLFYMEVLRFFLQYEMETKPFDPKLHMAFLTEPEYGGTETAAEYGRLLDIIRDQHIYEFMRIGSEITRHKTLAHIAGVHYIAMHVARQLLAAGVPVDIALVSGSAFGHDIGKYGCRPEEAARIPYLHYYYTDIYFKRNHMPSIGHIATNHSTWDLELENLSAESLILIYADFRVKSVRDGEGGEVVTYFSLKDSFQVILDKLDNVDDAKRARYDRVYAKLKDFEDYMEGLGVNTDLTTDEIRPPERKDASLFSPEEAVRSLKHLAIRHNLLVMHKFNGEASFSEIIETARSEKNWKNVRAYINIFQEYSAYMTQKQKIMTLNFLYELLMNREGDIRRQSGALMGNIIVHYDEEYRKKLPQGVSQSPDVITSLDLWAKYLELIIQPDHRATEQHRRWLGYALRFVVNSVQQYCHTADAREYLNIFLQYYRDMEQSDSTAFILLDSIYALPLEVCTREDKGTLLDFTVRMAQKDTVEIQIAALRFLYHLSCDPQCREEFLPEISDCLDRIDSAGEIGVEFLMAKVRSNLGLFQTEEQKNRFAELFYGKTGVASELFLENLKAATPWILKILNLDLLLDQTLNETWSPILQVAAHLSNLIKVSERVAVRHRAGEALLSIIPLLTLDQRNEIAIELSKGLEIGEYEFSKYIPQYLGEIALYLHPDELDELILDFKKMLTSSNDRICSVTLDTLGVMLENYPAYQERFRESSAAVQKRRERILSMILKGLSNYREAVSQEAFLVIGQYLFGGRLTLEEKYKIFAVIFKKMLTLVMAQEESELSFFNSAASLNHIYRFLSEYLFLHGNFAMPVTDPFSLGHKKIAGIVRDLGYEVYLAIDEFFWSKKTQPKMIRRQIISMSISDEMNVYLFPDEIPVNIGNPSDLKRMKEELFPGRKVHIVAGTDVIKHASAYHVPPEEGSIHGFPHLIANRSNPNDSVDLSMIAGEIRRFDLPAHLEEISSTKVRENIDFNRDISNLVDPLVQSFIYDNSLYLREPLFKNIFIPKRVQFEIVDRFCEDLVRELEATIFRSHDDKSRIREYLLRKDANAVIVRDGYQGGIPVGIAAFHEVGMSDLYGEFSNLRLSSRIRSITSGKVIILSGVASVRETSIKNAEQLAVTEALAYCVKNDFTYAIFHNHLGDTDRNMIGLLERQGFQPIYENEAEDEPIYAVDMKFPVTFYSDITTMVKPPFDKRPKVLNVIAESHVRIQQYLAKLYRGNLILTFDAEVMNHRIIDMVTRENKVPNEPLTVKNPGEYMCVPFGKILRGMAVPNTVTKSLHTEKRFEPELDRFQITEYPYYSPLVTQVRTIKSFRRPIILTDELLHKGYRMKALDPILRQEQVDVVKIIVGILSGRGKDLMTLQGRQVDSVYFIPNLRSWFVESAMYPFLGGDSIHRERIPGGETANAGLIPSINLILPYVAPNFMRDLPRNAQYDFSLSCLENTKNIMTVLEEEYQQVYERNLTMNRLSEAVMSPRYPDKGLNMSYDLNLPPSVYVANDIELLKRLANIIID